METADAGSPAPSGARKQRTVRDIRWVLILNLATIPLSLATNLLLGRSSAEFLGWYGAVQIFIAGFNTFLLLGGLPVFSRLVPPMRRDERLSFLVTYAAMIFALLTAVTAVVWLVPGATRMALGPFGAPSWILAYAVCVVVLVSSFALYFLWAVERAPQAVIVLKSAIVGYFIAGVIGTTVARSILYKDPIGFVWWSTLIIYTVGALLAVVFVLRTPEVAASTRLRAYLPAGFWPVVFYTHVGTIVEFSYTQLYPALVLVWLDVIALSRLHAALRFVAFLSMAPVMLTSVLAPGLARLAAEGRREEAFQQAGAALRGCLIVVAPGVFALIVFAPTAMGLFGPDFRPYAQILRLMAPIALASPLFYMGAGMAVAFGAFRSYLWVSTVFVVSSLVLAWVAIPRWGLVGAAAAGTLGSFVQQTAMSAVMRWRLGFRPPFRALAAWIVAAAVGGVSAAWNPGLATGIALWIASLAAFAWLGSVTPSELRVLASRALGAN